MPRLLVEAPPEVIAQPRATPAAFGAQVGAEMAYMGRQSQALGQVIDHYVESDARARAVHYETALSAEMQALSLDPDIEGRGAKFEAVQRRLFDQYRPKRGGQGTYDAKAGLVTMDLGSRFQHQTAVDGIAEMRRNTALEANHFAMRAAMADDDQEAATFFMQARESIDSSANFFTKAEREEALQKTVGDGIRAMTDTNPQLALSMIDRFGDQLAPEVTAVYRGQALATIRSNAAAVVAGAREKRQAEIDARTDASRAAEDRLMDLEQDGKLTLEAVRAEKDLDSTAYGRWKRMATGDKSGGGSNPKVYIDLSDRANAGEDVVEAANTALTDGSISRTERDAIVKTSRDERFNEPRKSVLGALKAIEERRPSMAGVTGNGLAKFDAWVKDNPAASRTDADARASEIIAESKSFKTPEAKAKPAAAPLTGRPLDSMDAIRAEAKNIADRRRLNLITEEEFRRRQNDLREAQQALEDGAK